MSKYTYILSFVQDQEPDNTLSPFANQEAQPGKHKESITREHQDIIFN